MWYPRIAKKHDSAMIALYLDDDDAKKVAQKTFYKEKSKSEVIFNPEPVDNLHVTLVLIDNPERYNDKKDAIKEMLKSLSERWAPMDGELGGLGYFCGQESDPIYSNFDCSYLFEFRKDLIESLRSLGVCESQEHGYTPHLTLGYTDNGVSGQEIIPLIGDTHKVQFLGRDTESNSPPWKSKKISLKRIEFRWQDDSLGSWDLQLVQN